MATSVSIMRVLSGVAMLAAMLCAARAEDHRVPRKKPPASIVEPRYTIDFSDAPTSNSPAPPPGASSLLRRDPDSGLPFLGLKLSKPLGN